MAETVPSCSSGCAVRIRSIRDRRIPVKRPEHGAGRAWQESSFQQLAVRLTFFTLRAGLPQNERVVQGETGTPTPDDQSAGILARRRSSAPNVFELNGACAAFRATLEKTKRLMSERAASQARPEVTGEAALVTRDARRVEPEYAGLLFVELGV